MKYYVGIDVGGTKIYSLVIDQNGNILSREKIKTQPNDKFENIFNRIISCYEKAVKKAGVDNKDIKAVGMAVPSAVNIDKGILLYAPNLKLQNINLSEMMYKRLKKPIFLDNDANMGIFGEYCHGAGKNFNAIYGIFVGTGIGGGYVRDGKIIRGLNYTAGEIGHMVVKIEGPVCSCGKKGCLEAIAGKVGMVNYLKKLVDDKNKKTLLEKINPKWRNGVGSSDLKKCFIKKDSLVTKALKKGAKTLGIAAANLINIVGTNAIIIGGGLYNELGNELMPTVKKYMAVQA